MLREGWKLGKEGWLQRVKGLVYDATLFAVKCIPRLALQRKTLLIIRTNNIGDYILWRDALPYFRQSERFRGYKITLLGNKAWKGLFDVLDAKTVDDSLWVEPGRFKKDMQYRFELLREVHSRAYEVVINTVYSRNKRLDDAFVIVSSAAWKIGQQSDGTNVYSFERGYDKVLYNELFPDTASFEFEWSRMMRFSEYLTGADIRSRPVPKINSPYILPSGLKNRNFFIVFPGSSTISKSWKGENFAAVTKHIVARYGWLPVIGGSPSDQPYVDEFLRHYSGDIINLSGTTSLLDFAGLAAQAEMMISIDTGSVHVAAFAGSQIFVLHNGSHYGRYIPYPSYINSNVYSIFPDETESLIRTNPQASEMLEVMNVDYNSISVQKVCDIIDQKLAGNASASPLHS